MTILIPFVLTACGGDGDGSSDEAKPYVDAMAETLAEGDSPMDKGEAECFSEGFVDVVGIDKVKEAGSAEEFAGESGNLDFASLDLTDEQGNEIYEKFDDCGVDLREELISQINADAELPEAGKECVEEAITDDTLRDFFVTSMVEGQEASMGDNDLTAALMGCMSELQPSPSAS
ncbi:hypothetical protein [Nocardioides campestrisoli]|uniref:hypothetical protein n=1 Tax=Nocardioides campestrisoli TaxID=2736757 RepID=UPI0015E747E6|nr:hypothetical protein [Nocardioides campestrisoli]